ncbi:MAG: 5'-3' exonuclease H3TH domain-containing protein [Planctomycetota bacterium]
MKVHLVDGTYELFRCFYGAPSSIDDQGHEVGASRALLATLTKLLRTDGVTHVAVAFDTVIESWRNRELNSYKTGAGIDPALHEQFPLAEEIAESLGLVVWRMLEYEADDALASSATALQQEPAVDQIVICTPDKDLAQCVRGNRVVLWDRRRDIYYNEAGVFEKWGVAPQMIPDLLALIGDTADGIPGLKGFGPKSAAALLMRFGHIDRIPDDPAEWDIKPAVRGAAKLAETLRKGREKSRLYRRLTELVCDLPLSETLAQLEWKGASRPDIEAIAERLGDDTSVERIPKWA